MATPTTKAEFKEYCLRALGKPVIEINVDDDQIDDRIDEALRYYWDYHFDGSEKIYYKHQITANTISDKYITMPENINGVVNIFDIGASHNMGDMFNVRYQIALNDLYTLTNVSLLPYSMTMTHLANIEQMLIGKKPLRYNRNTNKLYIDMDWNGVAEGSYLLVEAYEVLDPTVYVDVWKDRWLQRYATCLIQQQWGRNLTKFVGMKLPGGVMFNGSKILADAEVERAALEKEMTFTYSLPASDMIG